MRERKDWLIRYKVGTTVHRKKCRSMAECEKIIDDLFESVDYCIYCRNDSGDGWREVWKGYRRK